MSEINPDSLYVLETIGGYDDESECVIDNLEGREVPAIAEHLSALNYKAICETQWCSNLLARTYWVRPAIYKDTEFYVFDVGDYFKTLKRNQAGGASR
jgi:hypothetical protein